MAKQRIVRVTCRDISVAAAADCDDIRFIIATLQQLEQPIQGFCFAWETESATGDVKIVGLAPVFELGEGDEAVGFIAGTWFDKEIRRTKSHGPSIDGRVLQLLTENYAKTRIIAAPGFNGDWEDKLLGLGFRPVLLNEVWNLPDIVRQIGRLSLPNCRQSTTGLYSIDDLAIPMIAQRFEDYMNRQRTDFWFFNTKVPTAWPVTLEVDLFLKRNWRVWDWKII